MLNSNSSCSPHFLIQNPIMHSIQAYSFSCISRPTKQGVSFIKCKQVIESKGFLVCCTKSKILDSFSSSQAISLSCYRWSGGGPEDTDFLATGGLISKAPETLVRFILVSSVGVDRQGQLPFKILNLFGAPSCSFPLYQNRSICGINLTSLYAVSCQLLRTFNCSITLKLFV